MKPSTKAACLSLFIFPGVGLFWLKRRARGLLFFIPALGIISYLFYRIFTIVHSVQEKFLHQVESGDLAIDPSNIMQVFMQIYGEVFAVLGSEYAQLQTLEYFFIACWLCSAASSYFVGLHVEKQNQELSASNPSKA